MKFINTQLNTINDLLLIILLLGILLYILLLLHCLLLHIKNNFC